MMEKTKILININKLSEIEEYKKIGINNFLFAVNDLSIGYPSFDLKDIPEYSYLLINRVFDTAGMDLFKSKIEELKKYRGIIFEDLGVFNVLKDTGIELIWYQNHFGTNISSLNYYLNNGTNSAVLSSEITRDEIKELVTNAVKPVVFTVLAKNQIMYSRRTLLSNFNKHFELESRSTAVLNEEHTSSQFKAVESKYGTAIFNNEYFNYIDFSSTLDDSKIKFYMILNLDLKVSDIESVINGQKVGNTGFLDKKTVYKMSEYNDR